MQMKPLLFVFFVDISLVVASLTRSQTHPPVYLTLGVFGTSSEHAGIYPLPASIVLQRDAEKRKPPRLLADVRRTQASLPRCDSGGGQARRQMRQEHFKRLIRTDFNDPLGVLGVMAVRSFV